MPNAVNRHFHRKAKRERAMIAIKAVRSPGLAWSPSPLTPVNLARPICTCDQDGTSHERPCSAESGKFRKRIAENTQNPDPEMLSMRPPKPFHEFERQIPIGGIVVPQTRLQIPTSVSCACDVPRFPKSPADATDQAGPSERRARRGRHDELSQECLGSRKSARPSPNNRAGKAGEQNLTNAAVHPDCWTAIGNKQTAKQRARSRSHDNRGKRLKPAAILKTTELEQAAAPCVAAGPRCPSSRWRNMMNIRRPHDAGVPRSTKGEATSMAANDRSDQTGCQLRHNSDVKRCHPLIWYISLGIRYHRGPHKRSP